jgi:phosphatidylserine decarboxylase
MDGTSLMNVNDQLMATTIKYPPAISDDEEIRQVQTAFSDMIDQTCSHDPTSPGNIFEHTYIPHDSLGFLLRSIIPTQETIKHDFEHELPQNFFKYEDREGFKYAFKVLDRRTNQLTYEQMPSYHKYGMRLLFSGPVQRELLYTSTIRNFFARETIRLGKAFDEPKSRKHIPAFVKMYQINLEELLQPNVSTYFTFNEFFYRKLKPDARAIDSRDDPGAIVSAADCRLIVFDNISEAVRVWIKGHQFSLRYLFEDEKLAKEFDGGSIAVFRLAPVDYHRFHSPVKGIIGDHMKQITGTYYTVNPIAIKENLDVLTGNQRTVITIENDIFERVAFVAIGALLVGSVNFTVQSHQTIEKGDELGTYLFNILETVMVRTTDVP